MQERILSRVSGTGIILISKDNATGIIFLFGVLALLFGPLGLLRPELLLFICGFSGPVHISIEPPFALKTKTGTYAMRSNWIEHKGKKIFYQDFSRHFYNSAAVKAELAEVQQVVLSKPNNSVLVLTDLRDTTVGGDLIPAMNAASTATKNHVHKTAVLGVTGIKRTLADLLTVITGQPLKYFDDIEAAKNWLVEEE